MIQDSKLKKVQDGWSNVLTNLGIKGKDKSRSNYIKYNFLDEQTASALYQADDISARIVDVLPDDSTREGFKITIEDAEQNEIDFLNDYIDGMNFTSKINEAYKLARLYGGSAIYLGIDDGNEPNEPVNYKTIRSIDYMVLFDRHDLNPVYPINSDLKSSNFGYPDFYMLSTTVGNDARNLTIHESRLLIFHGKQLPRRVAEHNDYWSDSILSEVITTIENYNSCFNSTATVMQDFTVPIFTIANLDDLLCSGQDNLVMKRLELINRTSSIVNAIVLQAGENYERKTTNTSGLKDILDKMAERLVTASKIPHTILFGDSPSGLGASGNSEQNTWYDYVKTQQEKVLRPIINKYLKYLFQTIQFRQYQDKNWMVKFNPLWQKTDNEELDLRKKQAEIDQIYISNGVLDVEEVVASRFGGTEYNYETVIDIETRNFMKEQNVVEEPDEPITDNDTADS